MDRQELQQRAEVAMWGCMACAQPWFAAGKVEGGFLFAFAALAALLVALAAQK